MTKSSFTTESDDNSNDDQLPKIEAFFARADRSREKIHGLFVNFLSVFVRVCVCWAKFAI